MTIQEAIGLKIKDLRKEKKISQTDLAIKVGYKDKTAIAKIEAGKVDLPQSKIMAFAEALDTTPAYLMNGEDLKKDEKLDMLEDLLDLCGYSFDEYVKCNENPNCPLNEKQKASINRYYDAFDCCLECAYRKEYIRINIGTDFYKLDALELLCDNILNYSKFLFSEQINSNNKLSQEENSNIVPNIVYSNYSDKGNKRNVDRITNTTLEILGVLRSKTKKN